MSTFQELSRRLKGVFEYLDERDQKYGAKMLVYLMSSPFDVADLHEFESFVELAETKAMYKLYHRGHRMIIDSLNLN